MKKKPRITFMVIAVVLLPIIGYVVTYGLALAFPMAEQSVFIRGLFVLFMILALLAVPYWMLKLGVHVAHERNPNERELSLKDIPKDKEQLEQSPKPQF